MSDENVTKMFDNFHGVDFVGPFIETWKVVSNGYRVPYLSAHLTQDGNVNLILDERFMIEGSKLEVSKWVNFIANAMAVAAGYSSHGANCEVTNKFKVGVMGLAEIPK